ncbi:hypothetical protein BHE74_00013612 [Ensete ventricosum]|nr:hypothetical protein BHE74_00013612 [Ensete ventricosum]
MPATNLVTPLGGLGIPMDICGGSEEDGCVSRTDDWWLCGRKPDMNRPFDSERPPTFSHSFVILLGSSEYAIVEELAKLGAAVYTCSRNEAELGKCLQEWEARNFKVTGSICDVSSAVEREKLMEKVKSEFNGKLNILPVMAVTLEEYKFVMGAMNQLTKNLACEWAKDNIRTNSVAPGFIKTPLIKDVMALSLSLHLVWHFPLKPFVECTADAECTNVWLPDRRHLKMRRL